MLENRESASQRVLISILNWNASSETLRCIDSIALMDTEGVDVKISVIDNGSRAEEWDLLVEGARGRQVSLTRLEKNLGFAGGHNLSMQEAIDTSMDFVWLVNNDATVAVDCLQKMLEMMRQDPTCGAAAPVSVAEHDAHLFDFAGAKHDWEGLNSIRLTSLAETAALEKSHPDDMWVAGTAVLFRVAALKEIGVLNHELFAYFEDNDISVRLANRGWKNRMAFDAKIRHAIYEGKITNRPPYFFYLIQRNYLIFWKKHTPKKYRRLLHLRLLDRSLYEVNRLYYQGLDKLGDAALLGTSDGFLGTRTGAPDLGRRPSGIIVFLRWLLKAHHVRALKRLDDPNLQSVVSQA